MTLRHHIVIYCVITTVGALFAPSLSTAQAPGIADAASSASLRTAARITPPAPAPAPAPAPSLPVLTADDRAEQHIVELVNAERTSRGLRPLSAQPQLARAAEAHALDQRNRSCRTLSHTGSDGSRMAERVDSTGYRWSRLAENIACGYADVAAVMEAWLDSSGHLRNILHPDLTEIGVSLERSDSGAGYWVQVFGTPR